jgi:hypothetical protein
LINFGSQTGTTSPMDCFARRQTRRSSLEQLEPLQLLAAVPFGATASDTAEYMLGDVLVSVVLMESDGSIDADVEEWQRDQVEAVKTTIRDGLSWWEQQLPRHSQVHELDFHIDFTYADQPVATGYEPISRRSDDFVLWIEDFFAASGSASPGSFSDDIRAFNHAQRLRHQTDWAFTIFVVNAADDSDDRFDPGGSFSRAFSFAGGRFFVMPHNRPASTVAHETAHMFWALDEYPGSEHHGTSRGYYNTPNANAADGNPAPATRVASIMDAHASAFAQHAVSTSALAMIGWQDSDGDGIFDVLDVPHSLTGQGSWDATEGRYRFTGSSTVGTLPNRNPAGPGNDITLNRIGRAQYRIDDGPWLDAAQVDGYSVDLQLELGPFPPGAEVLEIRTLDDQSGVASQIFRDALPARSPWQNPQHSRDVNGDGLVSPIDALLVINALNDKQAGGLPPADRQPAAPYVDVNGDGILAPVDALLVINALNALQPAAARQLV